MKLSNDSSGKPPRRPFKRLVLLGAVAVLAAVWLFHPPVIEHAARWWMDREATRAGLQLEVGEIQARLTRPLTARHIRLRAREGASRTAVEIDRIVLTPNWPWQAFFGKKRFFRFASVENLRGVVDFSTRASAAPSGSAPGAPARPGPEETPSRLPFFPETIRVSNATFEILARAQSYFVENLSAEFSEEALGAFSAQGAEIHAGTVGENFGALTGVTAWRNGTLYLADLALREGIRIDNFEMNLALPGQLALALEAEIFGGTARGDLTLGGRDAAATVSVWLAGTQLPPLMKLLGSGAAVEGVLREGRLTFRGDFAHPLDAQASLRVLADGFRWNGRGWETLQVGANLSDHRLAVSDFTFRQKENTVTLNGEMELAEKWTDLARAPFLLNLSASIQNLGALAGLGGKPFEELSGRMSLSASVNGRLGAINGFVSAEGSGMGFRDRPIESGRLEVTLANSEAQIAQCELWSGRDYLRGKGSVQLMPPHQYAADVQVRVEDVASYLGLLRTRNFLPIQAGIAQVRWQGDGTASAHSGAFQAVLEKFVSPLTPSGLTGRIAGTYSPQNIYFSGIELEQGPLRFSTRATLAESGLKFQDSLLSLRGREIADAEIFLPLNPFALLAGKSLNEAVLADKPLYASVATRGALGVRDLLKLAGNDLPATGTVRVNLEASGNPEHPIVEGTLEGRRLGLESDTAPFLPSQADLTLHAADGTAKISGRWKVSGNSAAAFAVETPLAFRSNGGIAAWWNKDDPISAHFDVPSFDLAWLRSFFPAVRQLSGRLSARLAVAGTTANPQLDGEAVLTDASLRASTERPLIDRVSGTARATASGIAVEFLTGRIGGGPFVASGSFNPLAPSPATFAFSGTKMILAETPGLTLPADVELAASGTGTVGAVTGSVRFVDARFSRKLEVTPILVPAAQHPAVLSPARLGGFPREPFSRWALNVSVQNRTRFSLGGPGGTGELTPDLRLVGTVGRPIPVGQVHLVEARASFPFTTVMIPGGTITFHENAPWVPFLDLQGNALALNYQVQADAFGPLTERRLILRSDPALPQAQLVKLLATGMIPGVLGASPPSLMLRPFAGPLSPDRSLSGTQITEFPPVPEPSAPRGRLLLWKTLALEGGPDGSDLFAPRVSYTYRFQ